MKKAVLRKKTDSKPVGTATLVKKVTQKPKPPYKKRKSILSMFA